MKRKKKINLILVLVVVSCLMGVGSIGYAQPKSAPQKIVEKVPSYFVYEGSKVLVLYDPSGELIELIYKKGKWQIVKSEVGDKIKPGKIMIIGKAKAETEIRPGVKAAGEGFELTIKAEIE